MENFNGTLICATNFKGVLDPASRRRFHLKLEFKYLLEKGIRHFWQVFFKGLVKSTPDEAYFTALGRLQLLAPGDFKAVYERLNFYSPESISPERILEELKEEIAFKGERAGRSIGF